jgi:hypothetical protein
MKHVVAVIFLSATSLFVVKLSSLDIPSSSSHDTRRLKTGIFAYRDLNHGKEVGKSTITIRKLEDSGNYDFCADSTFVADFKGFRSQRWEAVASSGFEPISATLASVRGAEVSTVFELRYKSGRVTGYMIDRKESGSEMTRAVDAAVPANTVDQRIDWAAVVAGNLKTGQQFEFNVYDPGTGVGRVSGQVGPLEQGELPAGSFQTYRIIYQVEKSGKTEHYQMLASRDSPHIMLREEFPNGSIAELVQITEPVSQPIANYTCRNREQ